MLISHDKGALDKLCTQCLFVAKGTANMRLVVILERRTG